MMIAMQPNQTPNSTKFDYAAFESAVNGGQRVTLKTLADANGMKTDEIKRALVAKYGARVAFMRGRNGGIRLA